MWMSTFSYITPLSEKYLVNYFITTNLEIKHALKFFVIYNTNQNVGYGGVVILLLKAPILNKLLLVSFSFCISLLTLQSESSWSLMICSTSVCIILSFILNNTKTLGTYHRALLIYFPCNSAFLKCNPFFAWKIRFYCVGIIR